MEPSSRSSKNDHGTTNRSSSTRRGASSSRQNSQQQQQRGHPLQQQQVNNSARPEAFYASVEPLSVRRGLYNSGVGRGPDPDTNSAPNSPHPRPRVSGLAGSSSQQVHEKQASSLPRQPRDSTIVATSGRRVSQEEFPQSSVVSSKYYNFNAGISRREIIGRRCVGSPQAQHDEKTVERFAQTLRHRWKQRASTDESSMARRNSERVNNNMPEPSLEERPRTLPSVVRKSRGYYAENYNNSEVLLPEGRRVSRQDILNRRTSSFGGNNTSYGLIRRKSSGALEVAGLSTPTNFYRDERAKCEDFVRKNASFVKNVSAQQRSAHREHQQQQQQQQQSCNTVRRRRDGSLERSRAGGSRSVADFLTVSTRLRDITRGLVPRPSTLPKIVHSSRASRAEADWTAVERSSRDLASREAPIYGRIRRRKLSLPLRESQIRKSTSSLARFVKGKSHDFDVDADLSQKTTRNTREELSYQQRKPETNPSQTDMRIECKKNPIYGRVLRNTSSSKASSQTTAGGKHERRGSVSDKKSAQLIYQGARDLKQVSRRRIIDNVEDTVESSSTSPSAGVLPTSSMREIDYATIDFGMSQPATTSRRRESSSKRTQESVEETERSIQRGGSRRKNSERTNETEETTWQKQREKSRMTEDRGKRGETRSGTQEVSSRSSRCNHASTTLPLYAKSVRKSSSYASSGIPLKTSIRGTENRRSSVVENKSSKATSKSAKDRTNYVKKSVAAHVKSFSEASSPISDSPARTSSIFGFCTGKRRVRNEEKKEAQQAKDSSRMVGFIQRFLNV